MKKILAAALVLALAGYAFAGHVAHRENPAKIRLSADESKYDESQWVRGPDLSSVAHRGSKGEWVLDVDPELWKWNPTLTAVVVKTKAEQDAEKAALALRIFTAHNSEVDAWTSARTALIKAGKDPAQAQQQLDEATARRDAQLTNLP